MLMLAVKIHIHTPRFCDYVNSTLVQSENKVLEHVVKRAAMVD